jgi:hypothetical protein
MDDNKDIFAINKLMYVICAIALVVIYLDLFIWRP